MYVCMYVRYVRTYVCMYVCRYVYMYVINVINVINVIHVIHVINVIHVIHVINVIHVIHVIHVINVINVINVCMYVCIWIFLINPVESTRLLLQLPLFAAPFTAGGGLGHVLDARRERGHRSGGGRGWWSNGWDWTMPWVSLSLENTVIGT
jgi:hypothetical protein